MTGNSGLFHGTAGSPERQIEMLRAENDKLFSEIKALTQQNEELLKQNEELRHHANYLKEMMQEKDIEGEKKYLLGRIEGLQDAIQWKREALLDAARQAFERMKRT